MLLRRLLRRSPSGHGRRRGQGLVEFALITPLILLLLLVTIDFGRALYGWVVMQNATRVAANFAGLNPDGWKNGGAAPVQARYNASVLADLQRANCDPQLTGGNPPQPTFVDGPDTSVAGGPADTVYDVGDIARVSLDCTFHPLTPIISAIVGNNFHLGATSEFRIRTGTVTGFANPTHIPPPNTPAPTATGTATCQPSTLSITATDRSNPGNPHRMNLAGTATPALTGTVAWTWSDGGTQFATTQNVNNYNFATGGNHTLTLAATAGSCPYTTTQIVTVP